MTSRIGSPDTAADIEVRTCLDAQPPQSFQMKAGAGSGKTTSLIKALEHLGHTRGERLRALGQQIACITYTTGAVDEISADIGHQPIFHVSTIHSFLWSVIQPFQNDIRAWVTARIDEKIDARQARIDRQGTQAATKARLLFEILELQHEAEVINSVPLFNYSTGSKYGEGLLGHADILKLAAALVADRPLLRKVIARRFPVVFVDESQDTNAEVVNALFSVAVEHPSFSVGLFGDPMQKIYPTGIGAIATPPSWREITKPENFRCPRAVLDIVNAIRAKGDGLEQTRGLMVEVDGELQPVQGTARLFILPADNLRDERIAAVRNYLRLSTDDPLWLNDDPAGDVRLLVLVHRMAARRLGFPNLYASLHDGASDALSEGLSKGTAWPLRPFVQTLLPLVAAWNAGDQFAVISHLRSDSPDLNVGHQGQDDVAARLVELREAVATLAELMAEGSGATVAEILRHVRASAMIGLDDRFAAYLADNPQDDGQEDFANILAFVACRAGELWGYRKYLQEESPFATQQAVKGAQFNRVLVVLDDEEGFHSHFSYGKYLGYVGLSANDEAAIAEGRDSVLDRTRRLFYVCCSRASKDLAVVLFAPDVAAARGAIELAALFPANAILGVDDL